METSSHPTPTVNEVRFFLNQFRKGDVNDLKYRQALVDTFVNKIYLYDDKMTVLYNTQDSHSDVTIDDLSSSRVALVEVAGIEPASESTLTGPSPGADGYCGGLSPSRSPSGRQAVTPTGQVSFMMCGTGKAYRTHIYR